MVLNTVWPISFVFAEMGLVKRGCLLTIHYSGIPFMDWTPFSFFTSSIHKNRVESLSRFIFVPSLRPPSPSRSYITQCMLRCRVSSLLLLFQPRINCFRRYLPFILRKPCYEIHLEIVAIFSRL